MRLYGILLLGCLVVPSIASAHSGGKSFTATVGSHVVDIGYEPAMFAAGTRSSFDFQLWTLEEMPAEYDHVWVRVLRDDAALLATGVAHQSVGPTTLLYTFGEPGAYRLEASYRTDDGEEVASASFSFMVSEAAEGDVAFDVRALALGALLGIFVGATLGSVWQGRRRV